MEPRRNANAATHRGSCQCCGAVQKLPKGVLSTHGYTVAWGFFSGICQGTGSKPYEQGCDLIERFVALAEEKLAGLLEFQTALLAPPAEGTTKAWVHVYRKSQAARGLASHEWMEVGLVCTIREGSANYKWLDTQYEHPDGGVRRLDTYGAPTLDPLVIVARQNEKRARALDATIKQVRDYIAWQRKRVADWKEAPLLPREGQK